MWEWEGGDDSGSAGRIIYAEKLGLWQKCILQEHLGFLSMPRKREIHSHSSHFMYTYIPVTRYRYFCGSFYPPHLKTLIQMWHIHYSLEQIIYILLSTNTFLKTIFSGAEMLSKTHIYDYCKMKSCVQHCSYPYRTRPCDLCAHDAPSVFLKL